MTRTYLKILHEPRLWPKPDASKAHDAGRRQRYEPGSALPRVPVLAQTRTGRGFAGEFEASSASPRRPVLASASSLAFARKPSVAAMKDSEIGSSLAATHGHRLAQARGAACIVTH